MKTTTKIKSGTILEKITPKKAKEFLQKKYNGKPYPSETIVNHYAKAMKDGKWKLDAYSIKISDKDELLDGRHRLLAIVKSGVSVDMMVSYGIKSEKNHFNDIYLIGKEIKRIKDDKKLSYYKLSKLSGLTHSQIQNIENGNKAYTFESLLKICNGLGVDVGKFIIDTLTK